MWFRVPLAAVLLAVATVLPVLGEPVASAATTTSPGYRVVGMDGEIRSFGTAAVLPDADTYDDVVGVASTPRGDGYWVATSGGSVRTAGTANRNGTVPRPLAQPIVGIASTGSGDGYWLVARDGGIFSFGDAAFHGSTGAIRLNQPIVGMAATPTGRGYWLVAGDGGIFSFGEAGYLGSAAGTGITAVGISRSSAAGSTNPVPQPVAASAGPSSRPFAATSPWNSPIPAQVKSDPKSGAMVSWLAQGKHAANLYRYGIPIWEVDSTAVRQAIPCTKPWGTCGMTGHVVPVPRDAIAQAVDADGAMVIVDRSTNRSYEFYEAQRTAAGTWTTGWGAVLDTTGSGIGTPANSVTGAAVSRLAGVVRASEIAAGRIDHALVFSTHNACDGGERRFPAAKTDGRSTRDDCIPEGARVQLDPSIDIDALGLSSGERAVARALQIYGAYAIDNGGATMGFSFEAPSGEADPYPAAGFTGDYHGLERIPWSKLRVLSSWNGA